MNKNFTGTQSGLFKDWSATRTIATTVGVFFGLFSSINHGIFEILQGNNPTDNLLINAIGPMQRFWAEGTEPAFTILPNYLLTGIAAVLVGIAIILWSISYLPTKHGRRIYLALFILSFLVGGGIGQAFFFIPAWAFATRMDKPLNGWKKLLPQRSWLFLAHLWRFTLPMAVILMLIGLEMAIFGYFPGNLSIEELMNTNMIFVFGSAIMFVISFVAGFGQELLSR
ncbi:hypothetical protein [Pelolinea submarina]|uniref:Uncharacterized protein n=1 Tax=Pelolinea submarina TaxID=913107 RepID=A0A3E0AH53_9CHLR|nr:hypothetical protein [Pelolinea submarina]REG10987.1 hypothetical protein DFR64_0859 [Pelolinea submarina]